MSEKERLKQLIEQSENTVLIAELIREFEDVNKDRKKSVFVENRTLSQENQDLKDKILKISSIISYELGSPLNSLKSMVELLMLDMSNLEDEMLVSTGEFLSAQINTLQAKMTNLIEWSNLENQNYIFTPESVDIHRAINKSIGFNEELARKKIISVSSDCEEDTCVTVDKKMLEIILNNLISNAIKYSKKGGDVQINTLPKGEILQIKVIDKGIGMGTAKLKKIYDIGRPVQRGTANEQGLGLGLITVKKVLELHEVSLQIESKRGEGSVFSFELPLIMQLED